MTSENDYVAPHFDFNTGGVDVDRPPFEQVLAAETAQIRRLHALLAAEIATATAQARSVLAAPAGEALSSRWERDVSVHRWSERVAALSAARSGLCFGRLDHTDRSTSYIGRIGLTDPADGESSLIDWRAPAARPFYCATLATPLGVLRRRHFQLAGTAPEERVTAFHDDVLDRAALTDADAASASDPALLAALTAPRGSTMRDIVTTIQAEQDAIIRLPLSGVAVIEGGPGTGKTAVALHRVAYLLYAHRERLARSGVLVVGPSAGFISYVGGVLPALGESAVVFTTPGRLAHGIVATAVDPDEVAGIKGGLAMLDVLRRAVTDRQELPDTPIEIELDDVTLEIDAATAAEARRRARATGLPHNTARTSFRDSLGSLLVQQGVERLDHDLEDPPELAELLRELGDIPELAPASAAQVTAELRHELRDDLRSDLGFHAAVERLWPVLTPEQVLGELFAAPDRLASAGGGTDLSGLHRAAGSAWTVADAPLLDELAELLGPAPVPPGTQGDADREPDTAYAAEVLSSLESVDRAMTGEDTEDVRATDFVTVDVLAARQVPEHLMSVAERAAGDRDWRYGHLVVDEAQELSPMDWHVLMRRCPTHSITAVGDIAQRSAPAGAHEWADVLAPHVGTRWSYRALTVNYRTPTEIMALAAGVLAEFAPDRQPPESVRATGEDPWQRTVPAADLAAEVRAAVDAEAARVGRGTLAVIAADPADLAGLSGTPAEVHTPVSAKGLEFDAVVIVDPERIKAHNPADLYVSMTRATQRLGLLHVER